jgi:transcriptional regulator EpsA
MALLPSLSPEDLHHYHRVVALSGSVRSHFDVLVWLQGDIQHYLPHDIMIAAWGDFSDGMVQHDIISPLTGVRSHKSNPETITPLLLLLFSRWNEFGNQPFALNAGDDGFLLQDTGLECALGDNLKNMRSALVHGIRDARGSHDCMYVTFSARANYLERERSAMGMLLPHIDITLRQVAHLPHQSQTEPTSQPAALDSTFPPAHDLSDREAEVLCWVALGKTNPEIGSILNISEFTIKNHMQRIFKKLNVTNRAQAVSKFKALVNNV